MLRSIAIMFLMVVIGTVVGISEGLIGMGAGIVLVPALVSLVGMSLLSAVGVTMALQTIPVGIWGAYEYYSKGNLILSDAAFVGLGMVTGMALGAFITTHSLISVSLMKVCVGVFAIVMGVYTLFS